MSVAAIQVCSSTQFHAHAWPLREASGAMHLGVNRLSVILKATSLEEVTYRVGAESRAETQPQKTPVVTS